MKYMKTEISSKNKKTSTNEGQPILKSETGEEDRTLRAIIDKAPAEIAVERKLVTPYKIRSFKYIK